MKPSRTINVKYTQKNEIRIGINGLDFKTEENQAIANPILSESITQISCTALALCMIYYPQKNHKKIILDSRFRSGSRPFRGAWATSVICIEVYVATVSRSQSQNWCIFVGCVHSGRNT